MSIDFNLQTACAQPVSEQREIDGGPGWYHSSWELRHGLEVIEGMPCAPQLHEWLEAFVRG